MQDFEVAAVCRTVRAGGVGGTGGASGAGVMTPPVFCKSVNPISTRVADYAHNITTWNYQIFRPSYGPGLTQKKQHFFDLNNMQISTVNCFGMRAIK